MSINRLKIQIYYQLTSESLAWINEVIEQLMQDEQVENVTDEVIKDIIIKDISLETFEKIIKKFKVKEFTNNLNEFTLERISIMVKEQYIPFSIKLLDEMKEVASDSVKDYILYNNEMFFNNIKDISLNVHIISQLLSANELEKMKIFDLFTADEIDIELAFRIRELLFTIPKSYVESAWKILEERDRYQLLLNQLDAYSLDEISDKLSVLAPVYKNLSDRNRRHKEYLDVDDLGYNKKLLDKLKKRDYLTSVDIDTYDVYNDNTHNKEQKQRFAVWVKKK